MTGSLKLKSKIGTVCVRKNGSKNKIKKRSYMDCLNILEKQCY